MISQTPVQHRNRSNDVINGQRTWNYSCVSPNRIPESLCIFELNWTMNIDNDAVHVLLCLYLYLTASSKCTGFMFILCNAHASHVMSDRNKVERKYPENMIETSMTRYRTKGAPKVATKKWASKLQNNLSKSLRWFFLSMSAQCQATAEAIRHTITRRRTKINSKYWKLAAGRRSTENYVPISLHSFAQKCSNNSKLFGVPKNRKTKTKKYRFGTSRVESHLRRTQKIPLGAVCDDRKNHRPSTTKRTPNTRFNKLHFGAPSTNDCEHRPKKMKIFLSHIRCPGVHHK